MSITNLVFRQFDDRFVYSVQTYIQKLQKTQQNHETSGFVAKSVIFYREHLFFIKTGNSNEISPVCADAPPVFYIERILSVSAFDFDG